GSPVYEEWSSLSHRDPVAGAARGAAMDFRTARRTATLEGLAPFWGLGPFAEDRGGVLRHHRVDVEPGPPFEPRRFREPRGDLQVPVVPCLLPVGGCGVDVVVERRVVEDLEESPERVLEDPCKGGPLVVRDVLEGGLVRLGQDPRLEREPGSVWG